MKKETRQKLIPLSRIKSKEAEALDSLKQIHKTGDKKALDVLLEAQRYWQAMSRFREKRERYKRYNYGDQWGDMITVDGKRMSEEQYIISQGNIPLSNNLIRRLVNQVIGVYRSQSKEPTCIARDRDEQQLGETMTTVLQCNMQMNRMNDLLARSMEEFLISGLVVHRKDYGWRNEKQDCWTDYVNPSNVFIDNNMRDFRGWDLSCIGEIHDISLDALLTTFGHSPEECHRLKEIYRIAGDKQMVHTSLAMLFGEDNSWRGSSFYYPGSPNLCRVIEVWKKETKGRIRCHDYLNGDVYKIEVEDYASLVEAENQGRLEQGLSSGLTEEEIPLIKTKWFLDSYWYYYFLSPFGDILSEGETPYEHKSHPYVFKAYPFIDGEIRPFVSNVIDQQRYVNRLITLHDWIMRSSAKGVLLFPTDCLPEGVSLDQIADNWARFNSVIAISAKPGVALPQQISSNSTNIGIGELLNLQMKLFEDVSGIHGALQGKPGHAHMSASLYSQQVQNATTSLIDILDTFSSFVQDGAYKDVKNIQQFYDKKRIFNIAGKRASRIEYDPKKIRDVEFDLSIVEGASSPAYRQVANDFLLQIWQAQQISLEQLLEHGDFPFADELLQSIKSQREEAEQAQAGGQQMAGVMPTNTGLNPTPALLEQYMGMNGQQATA